MARCAGITKEGTACKGIPIDGSEYCYVHHPDHAEERRRHGHKGGKRGGRGRPVVEVSHIKSQLQELADNVLAGSVERQTGAVVSQILGTLLHAIKVEMQIREHEEFTHRLEALEESLMRQKGKRRGF